MNIHGLLVLDKPSGITSRDAVDRAARWFPRKTRIGHAGTLDPLATGVLVLGIGQATRLIEYVQAMSKVYETRIVLGATSDTDDADGTIRVNEAASPVEEDKLREAIARFVGEIEQTPPAYSAAHVAGRRAHQLARKGLEVVLAPRRVRIDRIDVRDYAWPILDLEVHCGKGTYIRSIARDLGALFGVGGYVAKLRRTRIGTFRVEDAVTLETGPGVLLPMNTALSALPSISIGEEEAKRLRFGKTIQAEGEGEVAVLDELGELVAIGRIQDGVLTSEKVIPLPAQEGRTFPNIVVESEEHQATS